AYAQAGAPVVVRTTTGATTGHKLTVLLSDPLGTATTAVEETTAQPITRRSFKPYGETRGTKPTTWPNRHTYLGAGIDDTTTGLTHLGAREYDQSTGRFISADPVIDVSDPLQINGYAYSNNNPISRSDPTGLESCGPSNPSCSADNIKSINSGGGSGGTTGSTPPPLPGKTGNKTTRHDQARDRAIIQIEADLAKMGIKDFEIYKTERIHGANKRCMRPSTKGSADCTYGVLDILGYDPHHDVYYVWEVKSAGHAAKAVPEAQWYVNRLQARGDRAVLGWTIGGPYDVGNGDKVIGPAEGAIIYGRMNNKKFNNVVTSSPSAVAQQRPAQPVPSPSPGPGPGYYPGTVYQPGLGTVPQGTDGVNQAPLLVPMIVIGGLALGAGPGEAAAGTAAAVRVAAAMFDLAA
ncbi:MAG: Type secretion protein Rhs, partial [Amycolatopsis sp.]|uniref:RHS repeat-associated core domain-containing protein n=1 Tax=Amycolatopsis sp. TaxID=37632 RepID=UPI0026182E9D